MSGYEPSDPRWRPPIPADAHDSPALRKLAKDEGSKSMSDSNARRMRERIKELEAENERLREEADSDEYEQYIPPSAEDVQAAQQIQEATVGGGEGAGNAPDPYEATRVGQSVIADGGTREDGMVAAFRTIVDQAGKRGELKRKDF